MDDFEQYLVDLGRQNPQLLTLVEAIAAGYKIYHLYKTGGIKSQATIPYSIHGPRAVTQSNEVPCDMGWSIGTATTVSRADLRCFARPLNINGTPPNGSLIHMPRMETQSNPNIVIHEGIGNKEPQKEIHWRQGSEYSQKVDNLIQRDFLDKMVRTRDFRGFIIHAFGRTEENSSEYWLFKVNQNVDEFRYSNHQMNPKRIPPFVPFALSIVFIGEGETGEKLRNQFQHGSVKTGYTNKKKTLFCEYYYDQRILVNNWFKNRENYTESQIYKLFAALKPYFETGRFINPISSQKTTNISRFQPSKPLSLRSNAKPDGNVPNSTDDVVSAKPKA